MGRRILYALILALGLSLMLEAAATTSATITIDATVGGVALPAALINPTTGQQQHCIGRLEAGTVRYWSSGTAPTAATGITVQPLEILVIDGYTTLTLFRAIRTTGTSGTLSMECWR